MPDNLPRQPDFPVLRKGGYDPASVEAHIADLQRHLEQRIAAAEARYFNIEAELEEARKREEAVHLTFVAATKTKEDMLSAARSEANELIGTSKQQAESLLAEAKKEAFRLVSEARQTAQDATSAAEAEAANVAAEAEAAAEATRNAARREAIEMIDTVESDTAAVMAAQEATIAEMRRKYEEEEAELAARVEVLRATAADLEARLKAIATGSLGHATTLVSDTPEPAATAPVTVPPPPTVAPKARHSVPQTLADTSEPAQVTAVETEHEVDEPAPIAEPVAADGASSDIEEPAIKAPADYTPAAYAREVAAAMALQSEEGVEAPIEYVEDQAAVEEQVLEESSSVPAPPAEVAEVEHFAPPEGDEDQADIADEVSQAPAEEPVEEELVPVAVGARTTTDDEGGRKGSYYSRRSAKLPRIGTEAGRSALAAANAIRGATRGEPVDPQDVPARTA